EKAVVQSKWYRKRFTDALPDGNLDAIKFLKPGNLYLFWGYRTYHANFPVKHDILRATFLMHQGDPHGRSLTLAAIKQLNLRRERRWVKSLRTSAWRLVSWPSDRWSIGASGPEDSLGSTPVRCPKISTNARSGSCLGMTAALRFLESRPILSSPALPHRTVTRT